MRKIIGYSLIVAVVVFAISRIPIADSPPSPAAPPQNQSEIANYLAGARLIENKTSTLESGGPLPAGLSVATIVGWVDKLKTIPQTAPEAAEARKIADVLEGRVDLVRAAIRQEIENNASGRKHYADRIETRFLDNWRDATITASGPKNTILTISYILIDRPFVHNAINNTTALSDAWGAGFKKVIFENGRGGKWVYEAPNEPPRSKR